MDLLLLPLDAGWTILNYFWFYDGCSFRMGYLAAAQPSFYRIKNNAIHHQIWEAGGLNLAMGKMRNFKSLVQSLIKSRQDSLWTAGSDWSDPLIHSQPTRNWAGERERETFAQLFIMGIRSSRKGLQENHHLLFRSIHPIVMSWFQQEYRSLSTHSVLSTHSAHGIVEYFGNHTWRWHQQLLSTPKLTKH